MATMRYVLAATLLVSAPGAVARAQQPSTQTAEAVVSGTGGDAIFKSLSLIHI